MIRWLVTQLPGLLAAADVRWCRLKQIDRRTMISCIKALAPVVQDKGAALPPRSC
jgi:thiamine-phosphate pyrophosphorylase